LKNEGGRRGARSPENPVPHICREETLEKLGGGGLQARPHGEGTPTHFFGIKYVKKKTGKNGNNFKRGEQILQKGKRKNGQIRWRVLGETGRKTTTPY